MRDVARDHGAIARSINAIRRTETALAQKIQSLKDRAGQKVAAYRAEALARGRGIFHFAQDHRQELLLDGKRTVDLPRGGSLQWENTADSLVIKDEEAAVKLLEKLRLTDCINYNPTVDKNALKAKLKDDPKLIKKLEGFELVSKEMFRLRFPGLEERVECDVKEPERIAIVLPRKKKTAPPAS